MNGAEQAAPDGPPAVNLRMLLREEHMTTGREGATLRVHELDAAQLLVFWEVIPALGRDVLVRIGVVRPDVDDAHALWERMAVSGVEEWRRLYAVTGAAQAMLILNELRAQWRDVGKELQRRTKAAPIGVLYTRAVAEDEDEALRQLGQWLRPWPTDEPPPDVRLTPMATPIEPVQVRGTAPYLVSYRPGRCAVCGPEFARIGGGRGVDGDAES